MSRLLLSLPFHSFFLHSQVAALVQILGLDFTRSYEGLSPRKRGLRYGRVMIMADQVRDVGIYSLVRLVVA